MGQRKSKPQTAVPDFDTEWRNVDWNGKKDLEAKLTGIQLNNPELRHLRIMMIGPVGAGKSCFINSVQSSFKGEIETMAHEKSNAGKSCTKVYKAYPITDKRSVPLPFVLIDVMGLEEGSDDGTSPEDIITALKGHMKDGYEFNPVTPLGEHKPDFIKEPTLNDMVHCLISVVPASSISRLGPGLLRKMEIVREKAIALDIPHLVVLTKADDDVCPIVKRDLTQIYRSRKIKEKMTVCCNSLGVPLKYIFPVSNYFEESDTNNTKDVLILMALLKMVKYAQDYVVNHNKVLPGSPSVI